MTTLKSLVVGYARHDKEQGLTQEQLAATCGVGVRFVRELEQGKETCHIGKVVQVMQMLGIEIFAKERGEENS